MNQNELTKIYEDCLHGLYRGQDNMPHIGVPDEVEETLFIPDPINMNVKCYIRRHRGPWKKMSELNGHIPKTLR